MSTGLQHFVSCNEVGQCNFDVHVFWMCFGAIRFWYEALLWSRFSNCLACVRTVLGQCSWRIFPNMIQETPSLARLRVWPAGEQPLATAIASASACSEPHRGRVRLKGLGIFLKGVLQIPDQRIGTYISDTTTTATRARFFPNPSVVSQFIIWIESLRCCHCFANYIPEATTLTILSKELMGKWNVQVSIDRLSFKKTHLTSAEKALTWPRKLDGARPRFLACPSFACAGHISPPPTIGEKGWCFPHSKVGLQSSRWEAPGITKLFWATTVQGYLRGAS